MKKKPAADPIVANRQQLIDILLHKSALKQDIADDAERVFEQLRALIDKELIALKEVITDERVRLWIKDRGDHEFHVYIGSDVLVFNLHHNVFRLPDSNPLWGTAYFKSNPNNGYFGTIHIYNFLAESMQQNRLDDMGNLIARIFVNHERHFFIEGKGSLGATFNDPQHMLLSEQLLQLIAQMAFAYALQFDLYIPPFEYMDNVSVGQIFVMGEQLKLKTAKRLGFKMSSDAPEIS
ncbi:MAG: hypothetical protein K9J18_01615 [Crocinitomicaceae bacterium]|jgi:hypothetical protein|nr:hypothetical protein [Crocinitomicaceae bacterium]